MSYSISENFKRATSNATIANTINQSIDNGACIGLAAGALGGTAYGAWLGIPQSWHQNDILLAAVSSNHWDQVPEKIVSMLTLFPGEAVVCGIVGTLGSLVAGAVVGALAGSAVKVAALTANILHYDAVPPARPKNAEPVIPFNQG